MDPIKLKQKFLQLEKRLEDFARKFRGRENQIKNLVKELNLLEEKSKILDRLEKREALITNLETGLQNQDVLIEELEAKRDVLKKNLEDLDEENVIEEIDAKLDSQSNVIEDFEDKMKIQCRLLQNFQTQENEKISEAPVKGFFPRNCFPTLVQFLTFDDFLDLKKCFEKTEEDFITFPYEVIITAYPDEVSFDFHLENHFNYEVKYGHNDECEEENTEILFDLASRKFPVRRLRDKKSIKFIGLENMKLDVRFLLSDLEYTTLNCLIHDNRNHLHTLTLEELYGHSRGLRFLTTEITLPKLRCLSVVESYNLISIYLLWCPKLETFKLENDTATEDLDNLNRFVRKHGHFLRSLIMPMSLLETNRIDFRRFSALKKLVVSSRALNLQKLVEYGGNENRLTFWLRREGNVFVVTKDEMTKLPDDIQIVEGRLVVEGFDLTSKIECFKELNCLQIS